MPGSMKEAELLRIGQQWLKRIAAVEKLDKSWIDEATKAEAIFLCDKDEHSDQPRFNILHSNVETIVPAIINSDPAPDIRRRFGLNRDDPTAKSVADILERAIVVQSDDDALAEEAELAAQDMFVAGLGILRPVFDADVEIVEAFDEFGMPVEQEIVTNERIMFDVVSWKDYRQGPAKRWRDVPWTAYRHEVTEEERRRLEDPEIAKAYKAETLDEDEKLSETVWEIWCRETKRVYLVIGESGKVISIKDDPLGLKGFFPHGAPMIPIRSTANMKPVCPYSVYEKLAEELDQATRRINKIMEGMKVRGLIAGDADALEIMAELGDNELMPVANIENLVAAGGLDKAVMWWPVDVAANVVKFLYEQREQTKQAIYEVTGISDIVRGQAAASETATAQQIKTQWGSLRVKKMQRLLERHIRNTYVICAEIICKHFSFETLQKMTGVQITPEIAQMLGKALDLYRIDIESDSTIRADLTKSRAEMAQFLEGTANFFATMAPVVQSAPQSAGPLAKMYASFAQQFKLGKSAEDALEEFVEMAEQASKQPQDDQPDPETMLEMEELKLKVEEAKAKFQLEAEKLRLQVENLQADKQLKAADLQLKQADLGIKQAQLDLEESKAEFDAAATIEEMEMEKEQERAVRLGE